MVSPLAPKAAVKIISIMRAEIMHRAHGSGALEMKRLL